jgi:hypothetical protein
MQSRLTLLKDLGVDTNLENAAGAAQATGLKEQQRQYHVRHWVSTALAHRMMGTQRPASSL